MKENKNIWSTKNSKEYQTKTKKNKEKITPEASAVNTKHKIKLIEKKNT